jgi:hypothetical protein
VPFCDPKRNLSRSDDKRHPCMIMRERMYKVNTYQISLTLRFSRAARQ